MRGCTRALIKKEFIQIMHDPSTLLIAVFLPVLLLFLYGCGVSLDLKHVPFGVVMEDPETQDLVKSFSDSTYFDVKLTRDRREMTDLLEQGKIRGFTVIPSYFTEFLRSDKPAPLQVIADGSEANTANFVQAYAAGAVAVWQAQHGYVPPVRVETRYWYNESVDSHYFLLSGSLAIIMTLTGTLLTALVIAREWERGTMEAVIATAVTKWEIIIGKTVPYFILGMGSMAICTIVSTLIFGLPFRGSFFLLALVSAAFLLCMLGTGLFVSYAAKVQLVASQVAMVIGFLPAYILSGFLFEISSMPLWLQWLTKCLPPRYFVRELQTLFLVGDVPELFIKDLVILLSMAVAMFLMVAKRATKHL